jgi:DNA-binding transcriptional MerR regulator
VHGDRVTTLLTVGELSRLTHLPIKTLHHYHEVGVLVPARVDPATGYRRYAPDQVGTAHLARRLRDVRMPLGEMRAVLATSDPAERDAGIAAHLERLRRELADTATAVASLHALLTAGPATPAGLQVAYRDVAAHPAVAVAATVGRDGIGEWCAQAYPRLYGAVARLGATPSGPGAALYDAAWFEDGGGRVTAFVPVDLGGVPSPVAHGPATPEGRVGVVTVPARRLAVALHAGTFDDLDLTYGLLGRHVLERGIGADGPIRETYLVSPGDVDDPAGLRTEIGWPVTAGATRPALTDPTIEATEATEATEGGSR